MKSDQLEFFRAALLALKSELEQVAESERQGVRTVELDQSSVGRLSRMDAMQSQATSAPASSAASRSTVDA